MAEASRESGETAESSRLSTLVALLIATVSVVGAIVAWRASVAGDGAGDADVAGIRATINLSETKALAAVKGYSDYASFTDYYRYHELGNRLEDEIAGLPDNDERALLQEELADTYDLTTAAQLAFPTGYLSRDGTYAIDRETGEFLSDASREKDINPDPSFAEADALRGKTDRLLIALSVLAVALVFYTLIEAANRSLTKYALLTGGTVFFLVGAVVALLVETGRL